MERIEAKCLGLWRTRREVPGRDELAQRREHADADRKKDHIPQDSHALVVACRASITSVSRVGPRRIW